MFDWIRLGADGGAGLAQVDEEEAIILAGEAMQREAIRWALAEVEWLLLLADGARDIDTDYADRLDEAAAWTAEELDRALGNAGALQ